MKHLYRVLIFLISIILCNSLDAQEYPVQQVTFSDSTHAGYPYWMPFGNQIVYSNGTSTGCFSTVIMPVGEACKVITEIFAQHARCSPDGQYFVFDGDYGRSIKIVSVAGGSPVRIDPDTLKIVRSGMPCWSPDSKNIAFHSGGVIFKIDLESGKCSELFREDNSIAAPFDWSADGNYILADVGDTLERVNSNIWKVPLDEGSPEQLSFLKGRQVKPDLSPDGRIIIFTSDHKGNVDLYAMPSAGGKPVRLTYFEGDEDNPGYDLEADWSPDGKRIAFSSTRSGYWAIWIMEVNLADLNRRLVLAQENQ